MIREGLKKIVEFSTKGGGVSDRQFSTKKKKQKNMGLKHWILPNNQFKTHLFFSIFGWGGPFSAWISVRRVAQTSNLSGEAIWQVSEDPYHTEFVSWHVDNFSINGDGWVWVWSGPHWKIKFYFFQPIPEKKFRDICYWFILLNLSPKFGQNQAKKLSTLWDISVFDGSP